MQLELFDRATDEDRRDAETNPAIGISISGADSNGDVTDNEEGYSDVGDIEGGGGWRANEEPQVVRTMRALASAVEADEVVSAELELIVDKLRSMGDHTSSASCDAKLWRKVR